ncbi:MAG: sterol desaturase family protein [Pseudomonadota bacterium]
MKWPDLLMSPDRVEWAFEKAIFSRVSPLSSLNPLHPRWLAFTAFVLLGLFLLRRIRGSSRNPFKEFIHPEYFQYKYFGLDAIYWLLNIPVAFLLFYFHFPQMILDFFFDFLPERSQLVSYLNLHWSSELSRKLVFSVGFVVVQDFASYVSHRCVHEIDFLWRFHKIHHFPDKISPLTFLRLHPLESLFRVLVLSFFITLFIRVVHPVLNLDSDFYLLGTPVLWFANNLYNNFSHCHMWVHWPRMAVIFRSPAMHLIHHEKALNREGKNYGNIFSLWDLIFGTYLSPEKEPANLKFGIAESDPRQIGFWSSLSSPFQRASGKEARLTKT